MAPATAAAVRLVSRRAAPEAGRAAGEVVIPTVVDAAVPVARPDVRACEPERRAAPPAEAPIGIATPLAGPRLPAPLARLSPLEVEVLARPAVPVSRPAHL